MYLNNVRSVQMQNTLLDSRRQPPFPLAVILRTDFHLGGQKLALVSTCECVLMLNKKKVA